MEEKQNKITIFNNKDCQFETTDESLLKSLRSKFSYKENGVEYTAAYKAGWNGVTYLITKKGAFYSGLLTKVKAYLLDKNIPFIEQDKRKKIKPNDPIDISLKLESLKLIPRDYQNQIVDAAISNPKGIIRACTGSGKTLCTAIITAKLNKPTIIYVIGLDLLNQFHALFSKIFDEEIGYIGDGVCDIKRINIASIWTVGRSLNVKKVVDDDELKKEKFNKSQSALITKMLKQTKLHIFDESHVVTTNTISEIYKIIDPENIYGFSGTPFRDDNTDLLINALLGEQLINVSAFQLIEKGVLAQPIIKFVTIPSRPLSTADYQFVYREYISESQVRNNIILEETKKLVEKNYTPLVLFKHIKHGELLFDLFKANNIDCVMLDGGDSLERRELVKDDVAAGKVRVILASTIFDIGIDLPILNALVLCGGGKSSIRALQRIGRVIRGYKNKKHAAIVDFYDQTRFLKIHSMIRYKIYSSEEGFRVLKAKDMPI